MALRDQRLVVFVMPFHMEAPSLLALQEAEKEILTMVTEFERSQRSVGGHNVTLTSWFDENRQVWHTSAPNYRHVSVVAEAAQAPSLTRKAALDHLSAALGAYLARADDATNLRVPDRTAPVNRTRSKTLPF